MTRKKSSKMENGNGRSRLASVSQNIVIDATVRQHVELDDEKQELQLPGTVGAVFAEVMRDWKEVEHDQKEKDVAMFKLGLGYDGVESEVRARRGQLVHFMTERLREQQKNGELQKKTARRTNKRCSKRKIQSSKTELEELIPEAAPGKLEVEVPDKSVKSEVKRLKRDEDNVVSPEDMTASTTLMRKIEPIKVEMLRPSAPDGAIIEVVDLSREEDPQEQQEREQQSAPAVLKQRFSATSRIIKEHTLIDKLLLGVSCIRHWTTTGLQLTRLASKDLALLNRRCTSINCQLSGLSEHKDDNNNTHLSVLLQCELFRPFLKTEPSAAAAVAGSSNLTSQPPQQSQSSSLYTRLSQKNKQHVPALYRQRHSLPSILSKSHQTAGPGSRQTPPPPPSPGPQLGTAANPPRQYPRFVAPPSSSHQQQQPPTNTATTTAQPVKATEPQPTASQLLRLKSLMKPAPPKVETAAVATTSSGNPGPVFATVYRLPSRPMVVRPARRLIPLLNMTRPVARITKISGGQPVGQPQQLVLTKQGITPAHTSSSNGSKTSGGGQNSVILKNLLLQQQQQQQQQRYLHTDPTRPAPGSSSGGGRMMTLSDFQTSRGGRWASGNSHPGQSASMVPASAGLLRCRRV